MKLLFRMAVSCVFLFGCVSAASAQVDKNMADGLKEALKIGTENAVKIVSKTDGFYKNDLIKIALPENFQKAETLLEKAGFGVMVEDIELSMNRAAEQAASSAVKLFGEAITEMTIEDAVKIVKGADNAATLYFQEKTSEKLLAAFRPIVDQAMTDTGVAKLYNDLESKVTAAIPLGLGELFKTDLNQYVTEKALVGLFYMVAQEEKKIRENPEARVTDLLKKIFQ